MHQDGEHGYVAPSASCRQQRQTSQAVSLAAPEHRVPLTLAACECYNADPAPLTKTHVPAMLPRDDNKFDIKTARVYDCIH